MKVLRPTLKRPWALLPLVAALVLHAAPASAWGDEGHAVIALIAAHDLTPAVQERVQALLARDDSGLVPDTGIESEAVWADRYRDSHRETSRWHYVDIERDGPDLAAACYGSPPLPPGTEASLGPADACVIDKILQFERELRATSTPEQERLRALQFLLHLLGDLHQPLHAIDDHDAGGNARRVSARGMRPGSLHHYWDVEFVQRLGPDADRLAAQLLARIGPNERRRWQRGGPADWAREAFSVGKGLAYEALPAPQRHRTYRLPASYVDDATQAVALQLSRAGVRLAVVLNRALQ
jgi:hypothetical protein